MDGVTAGAAALSTYGLYFIVAILGFVCLKLYNKTSAIEREFRTYMQSEKTAEKDTYQKILTDSTAALQASTSAIKDSTEALNKISIIMERMK